MRFPCRNDFDTENRPVRVDSIDWTACTRPQTWGIATGLTQSIGVEATRENLPKGVKMSDSEGAQLERLGKASHWLGQLRLPPADQTKDGTLLYW